MLDGSQLLYEGKADAYLVECLCTHFLGEDRTGQELRKSHSTGYASYEELLRSFPKRLKGSGTGALGIVIDADDNPKGRWESFQNFAIRAGYSAVPTDPDADGVILLPPDGTLLPRVGIWIMPDNLSTGTVETFVTHMLVDEDAIWSFADETVDSVPQGQKRFRPKDRTKAVLATWQAWHEDPPMSVGRAIKAGVLNPETELTRRFFGWLDRLFSLRSPAD